MSVEKPRQDFPSFWEGLSLREHGAEGHPNLLGYFPTFLQGLSLRRAGRRDRRGQGNPVSPSFFGRAFIEATSPTLAACRLMFFPSFSEGISLRLEYGSATG